ncbi:uncharacterized protein BDV17DRAFT_55526 [Aspergillus undulatus]|uniref:uncharacterized protein n=1 Tax=Aspergillus undulatus TaxID=1810928 RepID=UPI003CCD43E7
MMTSACCMLHTDRSWNLRLSPPPPPQHFHSKLLTEISASLDFPALCSFRRICRSFYNCSLSQFCIAHIETVKTDFFLASLQRVVNISQDPRLSPHVRSLDVNGTEEDILESGLNWEKHASGLDITQESVQRWKGTLPRLVNCQSFCSTIIPCQLVSAQLTS